MEENQEVRSREIGEGSFVCDSGPFIAKASRLTPGCLFWPIVNWGGDVCSCEGQMLLLLLGFPFGKNISLIYSIVLPGKAVTCPAGLHVHALCACPYTRYVYTVYTHTCRVYGHVHSVCVCICAGQVKSIEELPPSVISARDIPHFFILPLLGSRYLQPACP